MVCGNQYPASRGPSIFLRRDSQGRKTYFWWKSKQMSIKQNIYTITFLTELKSRILTIKFGAIFWYKNLFYCVRLNRILYFWVACVARVSSRGSSRKLGQPFFCFRLNFRAITRLETLATQANFWVLKCQISACRFLYAGFYCILPKCPLLPITQCLQTHFCS